MSHSRNTQNLGWFLVASRDCKAKFRPAPNLFFDVKKNVESSTSERNSGRAQLSSIEGKKINLVLFGFRRKSIILGDVPLRLLKLWSIRQKFRSTARLNRPFRYFGNDSIRHYSLTSFFLSKSRIEFSLQLRVSEWKPARSLRTNLYCKIHIIISSQFFGLTFRECVKHSMRRFSSFEFCSFSSFSTQVVFHGINSWSKELSSSTKQNLNNNNKILHRHTNTNLSPIHFHTNELLPSIAIYKQSSSVPFCSQSTLFWRASRLPRFSWELWELRVSFDRFCHSSQ